MQWITMNWQALSLIATGVISVASLIAKITPNETDNKWVAYAQKAVDLLAFSTGKTKLKGGVRI